jgi:hypothetical protein
MEKPKLCTKLNKVSWVRTLLEGPEGFVVRLNAPVTKEPVVEYPFVGGFHEEAK